MSAHHNYKIDFPLLLKSPLLVYLDSAASSQKPQSVIEAELNFYQQSNANVHRGIYDLSEKATEMYENSRSVVADFIGAQTNEIVFTRNATEAINLVARTWGVEQVEPGDEIWLSEMEHHSNLLPWQWLAEQTGAVLKYIEIDAQGRLSFYPELFTAKTRLVAVTQASNVLGSIIDLRGIISAAHAVGAKVLVDGAQSVPHMTVNVKELDADWLVFSGHKMMGPMGIGVLYGKYELLQSMPPFLRGGEMIRSVTYQSANWADVPHKFEAGTPNVAGAVGLAAAIGYLQQVGMDVVRQHEQQLTMYATERFAEVDSLVVLGPRSPRDRVGLVSFTLGDIPAHDIASLLNDSAIAVRAGYQCAEPLHNKLNVSATVRASWYVYNSTSDIDALVEGLCVIKEVFTIKQ